MSGRDGAVVKRAAFQKRYATALDTHLKDSADPGRGAARRLGKRALELGIETLGLARIHDAALSALDSPADRSSPARRSVAVRAAEFFTVAMEPIEETHGPVVQAMAECGRLEKSADRGEVLLASANRRLVVESGRRKVLQESLAASDSTHRDLLRQAQVMEEELRSLSHRLLNSHEEERRRISRELHDALGQTLTAINVGLASLKVAAAVDTKGFHGRVSKTQLLVQKSMRTVHKFARDLRPTLLDDLGLVPALIGYAGDFARRNSLDVKVDAPAMPAALDGDRRTALYRVAQEALINVGRHARAKAVRITLRRKAGGVRLEVWNDGRAFDVERARSLRNNRHLGLLCMRERMEMVGGTLSITSSKEAGTSVVAKVPLPEVARG